MTRKYKVLTRLSVLMVAVALTMPFVANAAQVTDGNLTLGDPRPGQTTSYKISGSGFTTGTTIRCVQLRLNTAADGSGSVPTGVTTTGSTLQLTSLVSGGSWAVDNSQNGSLRLTSATGTTPASSGSIQWDNVVNGSTADTTYYGLLDTYTNEDCSTGSVDSTIVAFLYKDGALVTLTVDPTLTFTVTGVASGQTVNGATTNITSSATAIDFGGTVTTAVKGIAAHDLEVATNANGGATVYLRQTGGLTNGDHTITPWTGSNDSPTTFPAAGTEAWGYTTADSSLGDGTANRFTTASNWAGMPTVNELVMDTTASGSQTTRVGQQIGISATTPAGNYSTTLVYSATGLY